VGWIVFCQIGSAETRDWNSDMGGTCPWGLTPPECVPGPGWPPNGITFFLLSGRTPRRRLIFFLVSPLLDPFFMMHHTVR